MSDTCKVCGKREGENHDLPGRCNPIMANVSTVELAAIKAEVARLTAELARACPTTTRHEPLFDLALDFHDRAAALKEEWFIELDTFTEMTQAQEQQALTVGSALEGVRRTTLGLMGLTREDS